MLKSNVSESQEGPMSMLPEDEDIRNKLNTDPDFIDAPKYLNSLNELIKQKRGNQSKIQLSVRLYI